MTHGPDKSDAESRGDFDAIARSLGLISPATEWFALGWEQSQASFPRGGPEFLRPAFVADTCAALGLDDEIAAAIAESLAMFDGNEPLQRLAWHCSQSLLAEGRVEFRPPETSWETEPANLPPWGEMFFPAVLLSAGPRMIELHRDRGIPAEITQATAGDLELWMCYYRAHHGRWGLAHAEWLTNHFLGRIYPLGRLQFRFERFDRAFRALRHRGDRRVVVVAEDDMQDNSDTIRASPVSPTGEILPEPVGFPRDQWQTVLQRGDAPRICCSQLVKATRVVPAA